MKHDGVVEFFFPRTTRWSNHVRWWRAGAATSEGTSEYKTSVKIVRPIALVCCFEVFYLFLVLCCVVFRLPDARFHLKMRVRKWGLLGVVQNSCTIRQNALQRSIAHLRLEEAGGLWSIESQQLPAANCEYAKLSVPFGQWTEKRTGSVRQTGVCRGWIEKYIPQSGCYRNQLSLVHFWRFNTHIHTHTHIPRILTWPSSVANYL